MLRVEVCGCGCVGVGVCVCVGGGYPCPSSGFGLGSGNFHKNCSHPISLLVTNCMTSITGNLLYGIHRCKGCMQSMNTTEATDPNLKMFSPELSIVLVKLYNKCLHMSSSFTYLQKWWRKFWSWKFCPTFLLPIVS